MTFTKDQIKWELRGCLVNGRFLPLSMASLLSDTHDETAEFFTIECAADSVLDSWKKNKDSCGWLNS